MAASGRIYAVCTNGRKEDRRMAKQTVRATERRLEPSFAERFIEPFTRMRTGVDHLMDELPARWSALPPHCTG